MKRRIVKSFLGLLVASCLVGCSTPMPNEMGMPTEESKPAAANKPTESKESLASQEDTTVIEGTITEGVERTDEFDVELEHAQAPLVVLSIENMSFVQKGQGYKPLKFKADAPKYTIAEDLSNIENIDSFGNLTDYQKSMIAKNGFVVMPTDAEQLFYLYEENTYKLIPNFITTDSVLQLYHIFYDYCLRNVESTMFYEQSIKMNDAMLKELIAERNAATDPAMQDVLERAEAYFAVANLLLGQDVPDGISQKAEDYAWAEIECIQAADGFAVSPISGTLIDYSLFVPRGHYTRSDELKKYFMAYSWYGVAPINFYAEGNPIPENAMLAIAICNALKNCSEAESIWSGVYSATSFMVGESDDLTPKEILGVIGKVYGNITVPDEIPAKLDAFYEELPSLRNAQIASKIEGVNTELQMRFMGQRYISDSEILQNLCDPDFRPVPNGVEVFAVYGSEQAEKILDEIYRPSEKWAEYPEHYNAMAEKFRNQTIEERTSNAYNGVLFSLNQLTMTKGEGYPFFMQNEAWRNKSLTTALANWSELRHDTILYGKQSAAECGGNEPPEVLGYVEPDPEFYNRLIWLTESTTQGLKDRGVLPQNVEYKSETMINLLDFLKECSLKELRGEDLSAEDRYSILVYGGTLEYISSSIADADNWYLIENETDRNMAVVADVHTTSGGYLEEGVGNACEMYVAIPQNGKIYLTRGAVFDYYEFMSEERLTDESWQQILETPDKPDRVPYVSTFMDENGGAPVPLPDTPFSTGC